MAKKALPRKTTIRGQRHLLAYITPGEAELLKAHGGSGELHNGIPSYPPGFGSERAGFGAERAGGAAGGKSGAAGPSKSGGPGAEGPAGMGAKSTAGFASGVVGKGGKQNKQSAGISDVKAQIAAAKKAEEVAAQKAKNKGFLESFLDFITPGKMALKATTKASQFMGQKFLNVLETDEEAQVIRDAAGRVTGVRDKYGRLTGRDPAQEREMQDRDGPDLAEERRRRLAAATVPAPGAETPTLGKRVIRTELAKETEAARKRGRYLGRRSLLSSATTLGA